MVQKVAIAGAGPAGLLLAHYLLLRGDNKYQIDIYERRNDPRKVAFSKDRTYPMSLTERGLSALRNIPGLEEAVKAKGTQILASLAHQTNGKIRLIPRNKATTLIDRTTLAIAILDELEKNYDKNRVAVHFNSKLIGVDFENNTAKIERENEEKSTVDYEILVGADGARSVVRSNFIDTGDLNLEEKYLEIKYKTFFIPRINEKLGIELEEDKIHSFRMDNGMAILAVPQPGNLLKCVFVFNLDNKNVIPDLSSKEELIEFIANNFPKLAKLIPPEEAEAFLKRPLSKPTFTSNLFF